MKRWSAMLAGMACGLCAAVHADPAAGHQTAFGALKYRVLTTAVAAPETEGARVYLGSAASALVVQRVQVSVDGTPPMDYRPGATEARALADPSRLLKLQGLVLREGSHLVRATVEATDPAKPDTGASSFAVETPIEIPPESALELSLTGGGLLSSPQLKLLVDRRIAPPRGWLQRATTGFDDLTQTGGDFVAGSARDPRLRYAGWLGDVGRDDDAAIELLRLAAHPPADAPPDSLQLRLAAALREAHLPDQATAVCDGIAKTTGDAEALSVERLAIGGMQHRLGNPVAAEKQLRLAREHLPVDRVQDWQLATAQLQFERGDAAGGLRTLEHSNGETLDAYRYMDQSDDALRAAALRRYNLATALLRGGDEAQAQAEALSQLDLVGRLRGSDATLLALRDQANLTLGWHFLKAKQGGTAMGILGRVRSQGLAADRALLGMGWAQIEPGGKKLERAPLKTEAEPLAPLPAPLRRSLTQLGVLEPELLGDAGPRGFARDKPAKTPEEGLQRALVYWKLLAERDAQNPAVQEGLLAIAYAEDKLGDAPRARDAYARAIAALAARRDAIAEHESRAHAGELAESLAALETAADLALVMDRFGLPPDETNGALYASIDRYLDLLRLQRRLEPIAAPAEAVEPTAVPSVDSAQTQAQPAPVAADEPAALLAQVRAARVEEVAVLTGLAQAQFDRQKKTVGQYLRAAYFSAARTQDDRPEGGKPE